MPDNQDDPGNVDQYLQLQDLINSQLGPNSANQEKKDTLEKQMKMSQLLRQGPNMPHGTFIPGQHGGVYVGPNVLQDAAALGNYAMATQNNKDALDKMQGMDSNDAMSRQKMMATILNNNIRPPMQGNPGMGDVNNMPMSSGPTAGENISPAPVMAQPQQQSPGRTISLDELTGGTSRDPLWRGRYGAPVQYMPDGTPNLDYPTGPM